MVFGEDGPGIGIDIGLARSCMYGCILLVMVRSIYLKVEVDIQNENENRNCHYTPEARCSERFLVCIIRGKEK